MSSTPAEPDEKPSFHPKRSSPSNSNNKSDISTDRSLFHSIAAHQSVLLPNKMTTLVIYIPTSSVGAVIGRKGQNITALQKQMAAATLSTTTTSNNNTSTTTTTTTTTPSSSSSMCNPRVSVVGPNDPPDSMPYTYSTLDWSESDHWTPVVIRAGDAVTALTAATRILALAKDVHDGVVMDLPLAAHKHAALVGKKGLQLANLSADHGVRIFVPPREQKDDIIQLEGSLGQVKWCLRDLLVAVASKAPTATQQKIIVVPQLPPASRLRQIQRRTETFVRKKKMERVVAAADHHHHGGGSGSNNNNKNVTMMMVWQLTITGSSTEQVEWAADLLQGTTVSKPAEQQQQQAPPRRSNSDTALGNSSSSSNNNIATSTEVPRRRGRGKGRGKNNNIGPGTPNNNNNAASDGGSPNSNSNNYNNKEEEREEEGLET